MLPHNPIMLLTSERRFEVVQWVGNVKGRLGWTVTFFYLTVEKYHWFTKAYIDFCESIH